MAALHRSLDTRTPRSATIRVMEWSHLLRAQDGVVARHQLIAAGLAEHDVRRLVRRRDLTPVLPGVLVDHTGAPTPHQRAWAAVLYADPAALWGVSALPDRHRPSKDEGVHVAVDADRRVRAQAGLTVHRVRGLAPLVHRRASPPRVRVDEALLDVAASARTDLDAIAVLADAVQARTSTPPRLRAALHRRPRIARRDLLTAVVADLVEGTGT